MEVERRERAVRIQLLLSDEEFAELCNVKQAVMPAAVKELLRVITGIKQPEEHFSSIPATRRKKLALATPETTKRKGRPKKWDRKAYKKLESEVIEYLETQRYATKKGIGQALGNPAPFINRNFLDKMVTDGKIVEINWRDTGLRKGIYYAVPDSPVVGRFR